MQTYLGLLTILLFVRPERHFDLAMRTKAYCVTNFMAVAVPSLSSPFWLVAEPFADFPEICLELL